MEDQVTVLLDHISLLFSLSCPTSAPACPVCAAAGRSAKAQPKGLRKASVESSDPFPSFVPPPASLCVAVSENCPQVTLLKVGCKLSRWVVALCPV